MNQAVAIRDSCDPFSQALSLLFKEAKNPSELKEKYRKEMTPLVTQVALKIGAIETEKTIAERAIPVFAGTISIFLMEQTNGGHQTQEWAALVASRPLAQLFREGYTALHALLSHTSPLGKGFFQVESFVERLEQYATLKKEGVWCGYQHYAAARASRQEEVTLQEFAEWLAAETNAQRHLNEGETVAQFVYEHGTWAIVVTRVLLNIFYSGKPSFVMDFQKLRKMVDAMLAEKKRGKKKWKTRAEKHYEVFFETVPDKFKQPLLTKSKTSEAVSSAWKTFCSFVDLRTSREKNIDYACLAVGIPPPGLSKEARKTFGP